MLLAMTATAQCKNKQTKTNTNLLSFCGSYFSMPHFPCSFELIEFTYIDSWTLKKREQPFLILFHGITYTAS